MSENKMIEPVFVTQTIKNQIAPSRRRVAIISHNLDVNGGVASVVKGLYATLAKTGSYDVKLISLESCFLSRNSVSLTNPRSWFRGIQVIEKTIWQNTLAFFVGSFFSEFEFQRYQPRRQLTELVADCDIIHVVCGSPVWAYPVCHLGKPVIVYCASIVKVERRWKKNVLSGFKHMYNAVMIRIVDRMERATLLSVNGIQVQNPWMLDYTKTVNFHRNILIQYAPCFLDPHDFKPKPYRDFKSLPYILCVARCGDPRKNIILLLEAYAKLASSVKEKVRLVFAGSTEPSASFWKRVHVLGLIDRVSYVKKPSLNRLQSLYQSATVSVLPSDEEGFGLVVIESMACGVPVISTRSGGPDAIITDGVDGYLIDRDDVISLTDRLDCLLSNEKINRDMGAAARQTIMSRFSQDVVCHVFFDMYNTLLFGQLK